MKAQGKNCYGRSMLQPDDRPYTERWEKRKETERMAFQTNLVRLRCHAGLSQEELAERLEVSRSTIAKWEAGNGMPKISNLIALSRLFGVSIDLLLQGELPPEPASR